MYLFVCVCVCVCVCLCGVCAFVCVCEFHIYSMRMGGLGAVSTAVLCKM